MTVIKGEKFRDLKKPDTAPLTTGSTVETSPRTQKCNQYAYCVITSHS